jgi:hypothetical protein
MPADIAGMGHRNLANRGVNMLGFNLDKTIQAASHLLKQEPGRRMNYMRLLKFLYIADRRSLERRGVPICGDRAYAMERGPVPGVTLDLIKGNDPGSSRWEQHVERLEFDVQLKSDPGNLELSRADLAILNEVSREFRHRDEWDMVQWCHENLDEFKKNDPSKSGKKRQEISLGDVLDAVGRGDDHERIVREINESLAFDRFFGNHSPVDPHHV